MGKTDIRDGAEIARRYPGVAYRAFDLREAGPDRLGEILGQVVALLACGELAMLPVQAWDVRRGPEAFRFMSQARHTGKIVLTIPPDPAARRGAGTALITGGTGTLGALVARHLAATGRARHLVLASRSGAAAPGIAALTADLAAQGAGVQVMGCDAADRSALAGLLTQIPAVSPLTSVVHAAGVLDDGVIGSLTPARVDAVMRPKADAAWNLHELTQGMDLETFVLFSSASATFGSAGQGNYAAANAFLDGLACHRRAAGLPAASLAWGLWADASAMTGHLDDADRARIARDGVAALAAGEALALLDLAMARDEALLVPARLDMAGLRAQAARAAAGEMPALLRGLFGVPVRRPGSAVEGTGAGGSSGALGANGAESLQQQLAGLPAAGRDRVLVNLVRVHVAAVLGHALPDTLEADRAFKELGFDSLTALELRNRLSTATGLRLPATLIFNHPTLTALARYLRARTADQQTDIRSNTADNTSADREPATAPDEEVSGLIDEDKLRDHIKLVTANLRQARLRVRELEERRQEPIAIVGMACRFPGGVRDPEDLWQLVAEGMDAISGFPSDRGWDAEGLPDPDPGHAGTSYARLGGFVDDAAGFDSGFFGISPREALAMDPQQRLLLEVSWEAVERAGIVPDSLRGSQTGVFAGAFASDYGIGLPGDAEGYLLTGRAPSVISGRVAYALGLKGPAVTVDTVCSSSLVALHLACGALRAGECTLALAGGVTVMATPGVFAEFARQHGLAADGRCKAFSAAADGTGWAEGAGVLVVERLSDARRNGHRVLAVVASSAVNQDGASNGLTAPNGQSQERVIRAALASAGLSAADVDAVEAHGTGTALGDPIEAEALLATYGQDRNPERPLRLGSVKSNIGHAQAAAGAAGVIKMVLALRHGVLPPTLHADEPSPHVDWSAGDVRLLAEAVPWPAEEGRPRRAGVSAFGISGTNAHVILQEPPASDGDDGAVPGAAKPGVPVLAGAVAWLVSGRTADGLAAQAGRLAKWVTARPDLDPADVGWSLVVSRSVFEHRAVVTGMGREELAAGLAAVAAGRTAPGVITGAVPPGGARVGFIFAGQGAQRAGMGAGLHAASPVFAAAFDQVCAQLEDQLGAPVADVVLGREPDGGEGRADQTVFAQAGLFAVGVGLVALLAGCGIRPDAVAGHSVGEVTAAYAAGVLSLSDACALVAARARLMQALPGGGAMTAIAASEAEVAAALGEVAGVSVAAVNGPAAVAISGDAGPVDAVAGLFAGRRRRVRRLRVSHAFHSHRMDPVLGELGQAAGRLEYAAPRVPWVGALTGELVTECEPGYWVRQAREPVRFADAVTALAAQGITVFLEIGPDGTLSALGPAALPHDSGGGAVFVPVLRPGQAAPAAVISALGRVHARGVAVDWAAVLGGVQRVELPTYAFRHQRFWPAARPVLVAGGDGAAPAAEARFWAAVEGGDLQVLADTLAVDDQRLAGVMPALAAWRRRELDRSVTGAWRYRVTWVPVPGPGPGGLTGTWLVVAPAGSAGAGLALEAGQAMAVRGARVITAEAGPGAGRAVLAARIGQALELAGVSGVTGVVSLLALAEAPAAAAAVPEGLAGTLALVQALGDAGIGAPLWVLTRGAVAAGPGELASPVQAMTWGLGRVAALEHPDRWGGLIDLPPVLDERAAARLCTVLAGCGEDQAAIRQAGILGRRLARASLPPGRDRWVPSGSVLITGGTGAVGGHVARWLAGRGAPRVVLAGRSGPAAAGAAALAASLAGAGTAVAVTACDIARRTEITGLLAWAAVTGPGVSAVMHAAGVVHETAVQDLTAAELAAMLGAKADGAALLDELTAGLGLEAFVLFSSISATWGSGQQSGYAAANAFLDALAHSRQARGLPAASVAWGPWAGGGMTGRDGGMQLARRGLALLDPALATRALGQVLDHRDGLVTIADVDWTRFAAAFTLRRPSPLIGSLPEVLRAQATAPAAPGGGESASRWRDQLVGLPRAEQDRILADLVRAQAALVLGHPSPDAVDAGRAFRDLGFDSLTAVELRDRLAAVTGLRLLATLVFDYPAPLILAEFLRTQTINQETDCLPVTEELDRLEAVLCSTARDGEERSQIAARLKVIIHELRIEETETAGELEGELETATDDEMFDLVERELGSSELD
jgi:acyl transferase domain-containing protein/acyl carrier protein